MKTVFSNSYGALHKWIRRRLPKPKFCECCGVNPAYDLANISQEYKRDLSDWEWLCRSCHMHKDGRLVSLIKHRKPREKRGKWFLCSNCQKVRVYKMPYQIKVNKNQFCSNRCSNEFHGKQYRGKKYPKGFGEDISIRMKKIWEKRKKLK